MLEFYCCLHHGWQSISEDGDKNPVLGGMRGEGDRAGAGNKVKEGSGGWCGWQGRARARWRLVGDMSSSPGLVLRGCVALNSSPVGTPQATKSSAES